MQMGAEFLYMDPEILVVRKRAGLPVQHKSAGVTDLESMLRNELAVRRDGAGSGLYLIHRLDSPVEGLLVFARNARAASGLNAQIAGGKMEKEYLAVSDRPLPKRYGEALKKGQPVTLKDELVKVRKGQVFQAQVVPEKRRDSKSAELILTLAGERKGGHLFLVQLLTGRFHQIRAQLSNAGLPIAGDVLYGGSRGERGQIALCAFHLSFSHPSTGERMDFSIEPALKAFESL